MGKENDDAEVSRVDLIERAWKADFHATFRHGIPCLLPKHAIRKPNIGYTSEIK